MEEETLTTDSWVELKCIDDDDDLEVENEPLKSIEDLLAEAASDEMLMVKTNSTHYQQSSPSHSTQDDEDLHSSKSDNESTDWIWDWSGRPEPEPMQPWKFNHRGTEKIYNFSFRKSKLIRRWKLLLPTLILTHLLTLGIGFFIGKRFASSNGEGIELW
ncbi:BCL2/adenovirus E1B 19 kDa protein-interacting protein 3-like [Trichoplax sp. H2]|nr:BCL2/adenovirus E1B 19 kDa protein-interacting protein 3-like [Trichoplax sp. H2]|eukprot:RDD36699.1 BCL2/adenovirus E1B 19 kDa protein-interacting protein 3-like [Trichoplax sp. H2]